MPTAVAQVKQQHPSLRVQLAIETSDVLMERLAQGKLDMVVGRLFERHERSSRVEQRHNHRDDLRKTHTNVLRL